MTAHINHESATAMDRRGFVKSAAGLTFAFALGGGLTGRFAEAFAADSSRLNAWVTIGTDGTVVLLCPTAEMGQGVMTSLPLVLAEELDADWSKVKAEFAPAIPPLYGNPHPFFNGAQVTAGSTSVPGYFHSLRVAGAQARRVLIDNVAEQWKVPAAELTTENGQVIHAKSKRKIGYGDVVKFATVPKDPPKIANADLKKPSQFKLIGRADIGRVDVPLKVNGSAKYGIDVDVPGMLYASLMEAPAEGAKAFGRQRRRRRQNEGHRRGYSVALRRCRHRHQRGSDPSRPRRAKGDVGHGGKPGQGLRLRQGNGGIRQARQDRKAPARTAYKVGEVWDVLPGAKVVEANYMTEFCYHAQMEPMNAVAAVAEDGKSAEIWTGTQFGALIAFIVSGILKTTPDKIVVHQQYLGGGYGRRIAPDIGIQAVILSSIVKSR